MESKKRYLGIDVGKSGGFVLLDSEGSILKKWIMPVIGKEYDVQEMRKIMGENNVSMIAIEDVHAVQISGKSTSFQFGLGKGILMGMAAALQIPTVLVQAKLWQKTAWSGVTKQLKASSTGKTKVTDTKATSLIAAKRMFPTEDWTKSERASTPHDGMVDAALIAEWCRREMR